MIEDDYDDEGNEPLYFYKIRAKVSYEVEIEIEAEDEINAREYAMEALEDYGSELPSPHDNEYEILEVIHIPPEELKL